MPYFLIVFLFLSSCIAVDITRLLEDRHCPQVFAIKGGEQSADAKGEVEMARPFLYCDVDFQGELGEDSFTINNIELNLTLWARRKEEGVLFSPPVKVLVLIADKKSNKQVARHEVFVTPISLWKKHTFKMNVPAKTYPKSLENYKVLIRFASRKLAKTASREVGK